jgi:hypothetical protein
MDNRNKTALQKQAERETELLTGNPNIIYDDTIVKYTINLPLSLYAKITKRAKARYGGHRSEVIRVILEREFQGDAPISFTQLVALQEQKKKPSLQQEFEFKRVCFMAFIRRRFSRPKPHNLNPPRRYHGFIEGIQDPHKYIDWKRAKEKILDKTL